FFEDILFAVSNLTGSIHFSGFIVIISCIRLSRFKLVQNRWEPLRFEFPFTFSQGKISALKSTGMRLRIKGESFNEASICIYYEEFFSLNPLSKRNSYLEEPKLIYIEKKLFMEDHESFYLAKVF